MSEKTQKTHTAMIGFRVKPHLRPLLEKAAENRGLTLSAYIAFIAESALTSTAFADA
jgi:uncharacterized protein (DUF1778 family)